jgi:hypothetical protein
MGVLQMTDVQQVGSPPKQKRKRARAQKQADQFDPKDVAEGKKLVATLKAKDATLKTTQAAIDSAEMKLGKLADPVETKYGEGALARFAKVIKIKLDRLNRCRSVYRAYKDKQIKGPSPKFAVLQALQGHPKRAEIIKERPDLTVREARTIMKDYRVVHGLQEDWRVGETGRWFGEAVKHALEAHKKYGHLKQEYLDPNILRQAVDDPDKLVATLRLGGRALITLADEVECALTTPPALLPPPMFDDNSTSDEAKPDNSTPDEGPPPDNSISDRAD